MDDNQLIKKIHQGNADALERLIQKYYPEIYRFCYRKTGNPHIAADLTQEVFLRLVKSLDNYIHEGKFKSYLFTIALNLCHDYFRKQPPGMQRLDDFEVPAAENQITRIEQSYVVKEALSRLPDIQKDVVILRFYHDLTLPDIADIIGANLSTTKSRLKQGLEKLKKFFREEDFC
ncbi:RNA polymerase sigma factor [Heliobacterium chlorum]|uniref:RNA polymerase sigma factor n=1 Tax=Heliobacterium chlorum TaxID=2698 RepID=UPI001A9AC23F|nr:RNA polymerase sigma factor [Heliobacterium chlorum]